LFFCFFKRFFLKPLTGIDAKTGMLAGLLPGIQG
jgi:hypothetical protein